MDSKINFAYRTILVSMLTVIVLLCSLVLQTMEDSNRKIAYIYDSFYNFDMECE